MYINLIILFVCLAVLLITAKMINFAIDNVYYLVATVSISALALASIFVFRSFEKKEEYEIVASTDIIGSIIREMLDGSISCYSIVPLGAEPHEYELSKREREVIENSAIFFINGLNLESSKGMIDAIQKHNNVVDLGHRLKQKRPEKIIYNCGIEDPHVWLDLKIMSIFTEMIAEKLSGMFPRHARNIIKKSSDMINRMKILDQEASRKLQEKTCEGFKLITTHRGFAYFVKSYMNEDVYAYYDAPEGFSQFDAPTDIDIRRVVKFVKDNDVNVMFREIGMSDKYLQVVKEMLESYDYNVKLSVGELQSDSAIDLVLSNDEFMYSAPERMLINNLEIIKRNT